MPNFYSDPTLERAMVLAANRARRMLRSGEEAARGGDSATASEHFQAAAVAAAEARDLFGVTTP